MTEWPPAWRDPDQYRFAKGLDHAGWAWEFLRRSPEYQGAYEEARRSYASRRLAGQLDDWPEDPRESEFGIPDYERSRKWGLIGFFDPALDDPKGLALFHPNRMIARSELGFWPDLFKDPKKLNEPRDAHVHFYPGEVAVIFNLCLPLDRQLKLAGDELSAQQKRFERLGAVKVKSPRLHSKKWELYLRVLDGEAAGATPGEMAMTLLPDLDDTYPDHRGSKRIGGLLRQAKRLRDGGYVALLIPSV